MVDPSLAEKRRRSPSLAALLSFVWPGLGQAYLGRRREAAVLALPAVVLLLILAWLARQGFIVLAARFASPTLAFEFFVLAVAFALWRVAAVAHAYVVAGTSAQRRRRPELMALGALLIAVIAMHGVGAYYFWSVYEFDNSVFTANVNGPTATDPNQTQLPSGAATLPPYYAQTVVPMTPPPGSSRVTILLTGIDSAPGRAEHLNDSILLVTFDTSAKTAALISVPRDTAGFPYYWGGQAPATLKVNSLVTYTSSGRVKSPDNPITTFTREIGFLVGLDVNYFATIDLNGFAGLIDKAGGVDINNAKTIDDPSYDWLDGSKYGFYLSAGKHHLNGRNALAYVRSRKGYGDNDYTRSSRQQEVLVALEKKLTSPSNILRLPELLKAAQGVIRTNFPSDQIADMVAAAQDMPESAISKHVLGPPYSLGNATPNAGTWTSCLYMNKVAQLSVKLFGQDSRYYGMASVDPMCG